MPARTPIRRRRLPLNDFRRLTLLWNDAKQIEDVEIEDVKEVEVRIARAKVL